MERTRLTLERIRALECPPGKPQAFQWDSESPHLAVRVTANGAKAFIFQGKLKGVTIRVTIGDVNDWKLENKDPRQPGAREEARRLQTLVDLGIDPRDEKRAKEAERAATKAAEIAAQAAAERDQHYTLRKLCEAYVETLEAEGKPSFKDARSLFSCHVYPTMTANKAARDVTAVEIAGIIRTVRQSGKERAAAKLRSYLRRAYQIAIHSPLDTAQPAGRDEFGIGINPVTAIPTIPGRPRERTLSEDELRGYLAALGDTLPDNVLRLALYAGGQRMRQLLRATVADWDGERLRLFDTKGRRQAPRAHLLPLGPEAADIVERLAAQAKERGTQLLYSTHGTKPLSDFTLSKRVNEISAAMGGEAFDLRDIRRTAETMLAAMGVNRDIRAQLLSHGISGVQAMHYDRHDYIKEKADALAKWEKRLAEIEKGKKTKKR